MLVVAFVAYALCGRRCGRYKKKRLGRLSNRRRGQLVAKARRATSTDADTQRQLIEALEHFEPLHDSDDDEDVVIDDDDDEVDSEYCGRYCASSRIWCCCVVPLPFFERTLVRPFGRGWFGCFASFVGRAITLVVYFAAIVLVLSFAGAIVKIAQLSSEGEQSFSAVWREQMALARERSSVVAAAASEL